MSSRFGTNLLLYVLLLVLSFAHWCLVGDSFSQLLLLGCGSVLFGLNVIVSLLSTRAFWLLAPLPKNSLNRSVKPVMYATYLVSAFQLTDHSVSYSGQSQGKCLGKGGLGLLNQLSAMGVGGFGRSLLRLVLLISIITQSFKAGLKNVFVWLQERIKFVTVRKSLDMSVSSKELRPIEFVRHVKNGTIGLLTLFVLIVSTGLLLRKIDKVGVGVERIDSKLTVGLSHDRAMEFIKKVSELNDKSKLGS